MINPKVLKKRDQADILPLDKAVNVAEEKIFMPENRKLKEKSTNPGAAMSYTRVSDQRKDVPDLGQKAERKGICRQRQQRWISGRSYRYSLALQEVPAP